MFRQTVESVKLNSSVWRTHALDLAQSIRALVYPDLDAGYRPLFIAYYYHVVLP